ncbi:factor-independent urate hydroxylase [Deinococcus sp.]|uniref:factor-independent urate hydroxylase n=1 Tax=Deinococcus sp. TaxID=47478 RepID=UPI003B5938AC
MTQTQPSPVKVNVRLGENSYGKAEVNLMKVNRSADRHELRELTVRVAMTGAFDAAHVQGDNTDLLATDTVRNTIYGLAKEGFTASPEAFGKELLAHFIQTGPRVTGGFAEFTEYQWERLQPGGQAHDHAFSRQMLRRTARVESAGGQFAVTSGFENLHVLKTTQSGWAGYLLNERFTTLPETHERVMATNITAKWEYQPGDVEYDAVWQQVTQQVVETFTDHYSPSMQHTLYLLGQAVLTRCPAISRIWFRMPNIHHLQYNLERFGLDNKLEIFHVDPEPYGLMEGWVERV